jgi:hypothetical protein
MTAESETEDAPENGHNERPFNFRWWESPRVTALVALAIAVIAVAVAIAAWIVPGRNHFSGQDADQAKTKVCSAFTTVNSALAKGTPDPRPGDPVSATAVAANVRLAMIGGSSYLSRTVAAEPAAPADLTKAVNSLTNTLDKLGFAYLLMADKSIKDSLLQTLGSQTTKISQICAPAKK